ncbi:MAG: DNA-binding CsgD family transcriptional regulator [Crocinitomicaceae bacterium]|jgi:DNA-binding CsgD family transcriptional regulator
MRAIHFYILIVLITLFTSESMAQEISLNPDRATALYDSWVYHNTHFNYDSSMYYGDEYVKYYQENGSDSELIAAFDHKIKSLNQFNKFDKGFKLALTTYEKYCAETKDADNCKKCDNIYRHLADFMVTLRDYRQGIKYLNMVCGGKEVLSMNHYAKAQIYCSLNLPDSALMSTLAYISISKKRNDPVQLIGSYNQHGLISKRLKRFDEAIVAFSNAIKIVDSAGISREKYGFVIGNLGSCYYEIGELDLAYNYLMEDSEGSLANNEIASFTNTQVLLAKIDQQRQEHQKAISRLNNILDHYDNHMIVSVKLDAIETLMQSYKATGNESKFNSSLTKWMALNRSHFESQAEIHKDLIAEYSANSLRQVTEQMDTEKQLLNQKLIEQENEKVKSQLRKWIIVSCLVTIILIVFFFFWRARKKAHLKEIQLRLARVEENYLKLKVTEVNKNVQVLSHELLVKQDFSSRLMKQLDQLSTLSDSEIKNIELFVQNELNVKSTRAQLQNKMGTLSGDFHDALKIRHPKVTESDVALAAMIAMNMSNKEIGISKNMSTETVKTTKYRLKKKLELSTDQDLDHYLKNLI